jgi:predicted O-methyltransferase YrrM
MSVHGTTKRMLVIGVCLSLLMGAFWLWSQDSAQTEVFTVSSVEREAMRAARRARQQENQRLLEARLAATLPQPFSRLLESMHKHELQLGVDGVRYPLQPATGVRISDGLYLFDLSRQVKPVRSAEVGFAEGFSTLYFLAALEANGKGVHVAMDPYETSDWHGIGLQKIKEAHMNHRFRFLSVKSVVALPALNGEAKPFDIIFIDGDHRFDSAFTDFVLSDEICAKAGYILLHDPWMPSVAKVVAYIERNRADYARRPVPDGVNIAAFQKVGVDQRDWSHFVDF